MELTPDPPLTQQVKVGPRLLACLGADDVKALLAQHFSDGRARRGCRTTWWHLADADAGTIYEVFCDTLWTDARHVQLCTTIALSKEWEPLTGAPAPEYDDVKHGDTATHRTFE